MAVIKKFTGSEISDTENNFIEVFLNTYKEVYVNMNNSKNPVCLDIETAIELIIELQDIVYRAQINDLNESNG